MVPLILLISSWGSTLSRARSWGALWPRTNEISPTLLLMMPDRPALFHCLQRAYAIRGRKAMHHKTLHARLPPGTLHAFPWATRLTQAYTVCDAGLPQRYGRAGGPASDLLGEAAL
jgi:hypothetical protein